MKRIFYLLVVLALTACGEAETKSGTSDGTNNQGGGGGGPKTVVVTGNGGGTGSGGNFGTSVPASTQISDLSDGQLQTLCDDLGDWIDANETAICTFSAVLSASFGEFEDTQAAREACASERDRCVNENAITQPECQPGEGCGSTVGDAVACYNALGAEFAKVDCDTFVPGEVEANPQPSECDAVNQCFDN